MERMKFRWDNRLRGLALLLLLGGAGRVCPQAISDEQAAAVRTVREIRVVKEDGAVLKSNLPLIAVKVGAPLDRVELAASIRTLYQTGDFADIRAVVTDVSEGVRLDFVVRENLFINEVVILGLRPPPTEASAAGAMQLSLGQTYRASDVQDAVTRLKDTLRDEGLYEANVSVDQQAHAETHQLDVIVHVDPGPRVRLGNIVLLNNSDFKDAQILKLFRIKPASEITISKLQSATDRIRKFMEKSGHLSARVSVRRGPYDAATDTLPLTLEVTQGPSVQLTVAGAKFSKRDLKRLIPVYQERSVDADLLEEGKRNLRERMERDGYFDAKVDYTVTSTNRKTANSDLSRQQETILYKVDRGPRYKALRIAIAGNHYFGTELLRSRLSITPSSVFVKPRFSRRLLEADIFSMKSLYAANGFLAANIVGTTPNISQEKGGELLVQITIEEGKQTLVSSLKIEGSKAIPEEELRGVLGSLPGQPYSEISVASDRDNILALYFNQGFPNATFSWTAEPDTPESPERDAAGQGQNDPERTAGNAYRIDRGQPMKLIYKVQEGQRVIVRNVFLAGYKHTRAYVIERQVKLEAGQPLREGDVVASQQRLYNLGIFNRVTIDSQNASGTDPEKDVVVLVEEAKRYTIAYGGGFEVQRLASTTDPTGGQVQAAPRGILELSKQNLTGRADSLSLKIRGSTIQGRALLAYTAPDTLGKQDLSMQATAYIEKTQDINTFTQLRYEGNLQLSDQLSLRSSLLVRYAFRKVTLSNLNIPPQEVPLWNQPTLVSEFSGTWFRDTRNNPADASKGSFNTADVSVAGTALGSSASFIRVFLQNSTYRPITRNVSFARSIRLGILQPYASTVSLTFPAPTTQPPPQVIPLPERLFGGGGTSLRGFALNQAGPRDSITGFPVGGQAMLILNQELRFPMKLPIIGSKLGGAVFYDGGNVYSRFARINLRWSPPKPVFKPAYPGEPPGRFNPTECLYNCTNELNYFSHTIGFGLRYGTPIGPIRIDLGYELNQAEFVIPCKNAAAICQQGTRLPKVQVFFNLGSSF
jgi:outer membrane protein insertion porin family